MKIDRIKRILKSIPLLAPFFKWRNERYIFNSERERFMKEAVEATAPLPPAMQKEILLQYSDAFKKHRFSFPEFTYQYQLNRAPSEEQDKFISRSEAQRYYRQFNSREERLRFHDKSRFLKEFDFLIHRNWLIINTLKMGG